MTPRAIAVAAAAALAALTVAWRTAYAEPSDRRLVITGLAFAPPTYLVGVSLHEGSHALAALLAGGTVESLHVFPPGRDPLTKTFRFGWTYARGLRSRNQKVAFYIAPKITDAALLGGFAALVFTDAWPRNRYGQLALTVFATGLWVDFAKDVVAFRRTNDVARVFDLWCMKGWRQIPARLVYAAAAVGLGVIVARGYERTFDRETSASPASTPLVIPLASLAF